MAITIACKMLGFLEKQILAYFYGTGPEVEAYLIGLSVPMLLLVLAQEAVGPVFLPLFTESLRTKTSKRAWEFPSSVTTNLVLFFSLVIIVLWFCAPYLIRLLAPGFKDDRFILSVRLTRLMLPASVFLGVSTITYQTLNAYKRFAWPALGEVTFKFIIVLTLLILNPVVGVFAAGAGVCLASAGRVAVHLASLGKRSQYLRVMLGWRQPTTRKMGRMMLPLFVGIAFSQVDGVIDNMLASTLCQGSIAGLSYARKIVDLPILAIPYALGIVIFPYFSRLAAREDWAELAQLFRDALRWMILVVTPIAFLIAVARNPIVMLLFQRGEFDVLSTQLTASPLGFYALGMPAFAAEILIMQAYFSMKDTFTPILIGVACVLVNIVLTILLIRILGNGGIALALAFSKTLKVILLLALLRRRLPA